MMRTGDPTLRELLAEEREAQTKGEAAEGFSLLERVERAGDAEIPDAHPSVGDARDLGHSQRQGSASEARELLSKYRSASATKTSQVEAKDASRTEPVSLPQIGAVVRCKASLLRSPRRTSGRVKAILSEQYGPAVVIQSIWGDEVTVTAREYSCFFEECDPRDVARLYWESS
jgi:hypothetical protein